MNPLALVPSIPGNPINFFPSLRPPRLCGSIFPLKIGRSSWSRTSTCGDMNPVLYR